MYDLKTYIIREWNSVPLSLIRNLCSVFIERVKIVLGLNGSCLEPEHLKKNQKKKYINDILQKYYQHSNLFIMIKKYFY